MLQNLSLVMIFSAALWSVSPMAPFSNPAGGVHIVQELKAQKTQGGRDLQMFSQFAQYVLPFLLAVSFPKLYCYPVAKLSG